MGSYDFDAVLERRSTGSIKWSLPGNDDRWLPYPSEAGSPHAAGLLPMWLADMDFETAPEITAALRQRVDHGVFGYTAYQDSFFEAIVDWTSRRHGWQLQPEWIVPTSGVMPAINLLVQTFTAPGDAVVVQPPVFRPIPQAAELNGRRVQPNPLVISEGRYRMDLADLEAKAADPATTMMVLCNPHNPVGRAWSPQELRAVAAICRDHDVLLVSDEIHGDLTYPWASFTSAGALGGEHPSRLAVCSGPSKAFNLPGLKLSVTIIPDDELRAAFRTTLRNQNELWGANVMGAAALEATYRHGEDWLQELLAYVAGNLEYVEHFLAARLPPMSLIRPEALYLLWIDCRELGMTSAELDSRLRDAGLWVEPGATYGTEGDGFIRMTIACPRLLLAEAMRRLERAVIGASDD